MSRRCKEEEDSSFELKKLSYACDALSSMGATEEGCCNSLIDYIVKSVKLLN